jgi:hypothetical protein
MKTRKPLAALVALTFATAFSSVTALATEYRVTITNLTAGQTFTPMLVVAHRPGRHLFMPGEMATPEIEAIAEGGNTEPMQMMLDASPDVQKTLSTGGLLEPGESVTLSMDTEKRFRGFSILGMLIPTNDAFLALDNLRAPKKKGRSVSGFLYAWDAGTEMNDESCAHIPGPVCGGAGPSAEEGEGFIHIHSGIHGIGDLPPETYDWNNPVARVTIERME